MENNNGKGIFYGVIGVATLVVAIIGATFAFFAASTGGNAGAVAANSVSLRDTLGFQEVTDVREQLIPVTETIMKSSYEQSGDGNKAKCKGVSAADATATYDLCSTYQFTIENKANVAQQVYVSFKSVLNEYENLKYCIFDGAHTSGGNLTTGEKTVVACKNVPATGATDTDVFNENIPAATSSTVFGTHTYTLVLFINEKTDGDGNPVDQTSVDSGKSFTGTVTATTSGGGATVTGVLAA